MESFDKPISLTTEEQSILGDEESESETYDPSPISLAGGETYNTEESGPNAESLRNRAPYGNQVGKGNYIRLRFSEVEC